MGKKKEIKMTQELSMAKFTLAKAKDHVRNLTPKLEEHLIKLVLFGDRKGWRDEVAAWCSSIQQIRVNLPKRKFLTKQEYLDCMNEYDYPDNVTNFRNKVLEIERNLNPKMAQTRSLDSAMQKVHYLQIRLADMWSNYEYTRAKFDTILDITLKT